jgi:hypothetical protein
LRAAITPSSAATSTTSSVSQTVHGHEATRGCDDGVREVLARGLKAPLPAPPLAISAQSAPVWRIIELVTFYLRQIIQREPEVASFQRSFVFAVLNYFEVTFWFAVWYSAFVKYGSLKIASSLPTGLAIFRESLAMMLVNTSNAFEQASWCVWTAMCVQSVVGLFLTLVVVARTVASLPILTSDSASTTTPPAERG